MATHQMNELIKAAGRIAARPLTPAEEKTLEGYYQQAQGTDVQRGVEALRRLFGWQDAELKSYRASSDNNDRIFRDIENALRPKR